MRGSASNVMSHVILGLKQIFYILVIKTYLCLINPHITVGNMWGETIIDGDKMGGDLLNSAITVSNLKTVTVNKVIKVEFF